MLKSFELFIQENLDSDETLQDIRHFKGSFKEFKDWFDKKAGANTNAYDDVEFEYPVKRKAYNTQPVYQTFGIVNVPDSEKN
jgi:hypothetical protein